MTRAEKCGCVEWLLDNKKRATQTEIATLAGVSVRTVKRIVAKQKGPLSPILPGGSESASEVPVAESGRVKHGGPPASDYGKCPNCAGTKWTLDEFGPVCAKCNQPHGEPSGGPDEDRVGIQKSKFTKTTEANMRAADDLNHLCPKPKEHEESIRLCKLLLKIGRER
jgi:hypothetical protein